MYGLRTERRDDASKEDQAIRTDTGKSLECALRFQLKEYAERKETSEYRAKVQRSGGGARLWLWVIKP
jgi:hypothetical protein